MFPYFTSSARSGEGSRVRTSIAVVLLALGIGLFGGQVGWAQTPTQTLSLDAGWNLVSLRVQPDDASLSTIFGSVGPFHMVKDAGGRAYIPSEGVGELQTWAPDEGYRVYVESPVTLDVSGTAVPARSTPVVLEKGGNLVPFFAGMPLATEEALRSVQSSLLQVEGEGGAVYDPDAPTAALDSLRPSQGYKVYVDRPDTLEYPIVVSTLAEAKELQGVEVGKIVRVRGYHEPGDGGGGTFEVTDSGAKTDGGTVFLFDEDLSAEQSSSFNTSELQDETLPDSNIVWGTVNVQLGQSSGQPSVGYERLHGHQKNKGDHEQIYPALDYETGTFQAAGGRFKSARDNVGGSGFNVTYKHATSTRRLERVGVSNSVNIDWWGAPKADPQNPQNARVPIVWAINKAKELYETNNLNWAYVDIPGHYYYRYRTHILNGVKLRGASNQTFGTAANGKETKGKLTLMPGTALENLKSSWGALNKAFNIQHDLTHGFGVEKIGAVALEIDGNINSNLDPFKNPDDYGGLSHIQNKLQNGNHWNGFYSRGAQLTDPAEGAIADFSGTYLHDFPGNGIAQESQFDFSPTTDLRVGSAPRNHALYDPRGTYEGITIDGDSWFEMIKVTKKNASFKGLAMVPEPNQLNNYLGTETRILINHGGKKTPLNWLGESQKRPGWEIHVEDFDFEIGSQNRNGMKMKLGGYGGVVKSGNIKTHPGEEQFDLIDPNDTNGNGTVRDYVFEDITVEDRGGGFAIMSRGEQSTHNEIKNIIVESGASSSDDATIFFLRRGDPSEFAEHDDTVSGDSVPLPMAARLDLKNIDLRRSRSWEIFKGHKSGSHPYNVFADNFSVDNDGDSDSGYEKRSHGLLYDIGGSSILVFLNNSTFNVYDVPFLNRGHRTHRALAQGNYALRIRNCQDRQGRTSDIVSQTYTSDASDEGNDYVLIPTSLMSYPRSKSATVTSGARSVSSVEVSSGDPTPPFDRYDEPMDPTLRVNLDAPIQAGNTITVEYTARVTPLEDYRTTGLFVAREVADKSYTSGNGPWQIDLRGVAASQGSKEPIEYSVTSSDTSVITTSMQTTTGTDGNDHSYLLDLAEQGAGTATVTVTGSINGVGKTTDTFVVSIE